MNPDTANLRRLCAIRSVVIAGQFLALEFAKHQLGWMLPYVTLELLLGVIALFALFCWWRSYQRWPVIELELFVQLCVDVALRPTTQRRNVASRRTLEESKTQECVWGDMYTQT